MNTVLSKLLLIMHIIERMGGGGGRGENSGIPVNFEILVQAYLLDLDSEVLVCTPVH